MPNSYRTIFKSSVLIGGVQVINIALGVLRTKVSAIFLGPTGIGLIGLYSSATELIGTITGLGIGSSGVRQIAEAAGANDEEIISRTIITIRRASLVSGFFGMLVIMLLCVPLSRLTFGDNKHILGMGLMSLTLFFGGISAGQLAILKGLRLLNKLALSQVFGALFGTIASVIFIYYLREKGVVPYLVAISAFGILTSWWYARQVNVKPVSLSIKETLHESKTLLGLGIAFMISALFVAGTAYSIRIIILRELGNEAVGLYQATWTLSSLYVGFVLNAMLTDFYPRLTAAAKDNETVNRLVNEQTEMGLLIAIPGVLCTIALAPLVLSVFYSGEFMAAAVVIRWQSLGIALRVICWPMGFIQLAKGKGRIFVFTELAASVIYFILTLVGIKIIGLEGAGVAFALLFIYQTIVMSFVCRSLSGFKWAPSVLRILLLSVLAVIIAIVISRLFSQTIGMFGGVFITICASIVSLVGLERRLGYKLWKLFKDRFKSKNIHKGTDPKKNEP